MKLLAGRAPILNMDHMSTMALAYMQRMATEERHRGLGKVLENIKEGIGPKAKNHSHFWKMHEIQMPVKSVRFWEDNVCL